MEKKPSKAPLRLGLLLDSFVKSRWVYKIIADLQASSVADLVLVVKDDSPAAKQEPAVQKIWDQRKYWLYKAYSKLDDSIGKGEPDAFEPVDIKELLSHCALRYVKPQRKKYSDYFLAEDIAAINDYKLDVLLYFGRRILRGDILNTAKYGVWSYHHGDNLVNRGGPPGFWEVMEGHPVTGAILQILTEDLDGGKIIYRSYAPTHKSSVRKNRNNYYWKSTAFVQRKLEDLYKNGPQALDDDPYANAFHPYCRRLYRNPTNRELWPLLLKLGTAKAADKFQGLMGTKQWFLAYRVKRGGMGIDDTFYRYKPMMPASDRYWANPFPVKKDDKYFIFIKECLFKDNKGHIAVIEMDQSGKYSQPVKVLEQSYHLSYPFIFQWQGEYYMIPETAQNRTIELYRCTSFPFEWQLESVLMTDVDAADATLAEIDGLWWMFVNMSLDGMANNHDELHLFYAKTPLGPWQPHRQNPVKSDARSARPAGRLFRWRGQLYRPAQDCSKGYGYAISINKINHIDPDKFVETEVSKILPQWSKNVSGTHTLNNAAELTIIDGLVKVTKPNLMKVFS